MKLDAWLQEATGTFPRGVRERLRQEYGAHLADSILAGGSDDPFELFGDPRAVRKVLNKSYIQQTQLSALRTQSHWAYWVMGGLSLLSPVMEMATRFSAQAILTVRMILMAFFLSWHITRKLQHERSVASRYMLAFGIYLLLQAEHQLFGNPAGLTARLLGAVSLASLLLFTAQALAQDKRVRHTLELEEASFEKRRISLHPDR